MREGIMLRDKTVVLAVTGGIAAYKGANLVRELKRAGADVFVIMTEHATEFITPLTMETLSQNPVAVGLFDKTNQWELEHIALADRADLLVVAPATANIISKAACGIADDLVSTTILTMMTTVPILMAPAMNDRMWANPIIQTHVSDLREVGVAFVGPGEGLLADGRTGQGRMADEQEIIDAAARLLAP
jgi:phosphopantothenoylcysteine decarboxylase/phosphopantothenate--cysteine ligase